MKRILSFNIVMAFLLSLISFAHADSTEKIILISGIDFAKTGKCKKQACPDTEYLYHRDLGDILNQQLNQQQKLADIHTFKWSQDMIRHGESLKDKFNQWFHSEVCQAGQACNLSFIAHSWGTIITTDFITALPSNTAFKIRTVITYGSPVTGAMISPFRSSFWQDAIVRVGDVDNWIDNQPARWVNIVNFADPLAWDYLDDFGFPFPNVENLTADGFTSFKGRLEEVYPVKDSEFDPRFLPFSALSELNQGGENAVKVITSLWNQGNPDFKAHGTPSYEPTRLVNYVIERLPNAKHNKNPITSLAQQQIQACINTFSTYFGRPDSEAYACGNDQYLCQLTTGGLRGQVLAIAVPQQLQSGFYYYWNGWGGPVDLAYCQ